VDAGSKERRSERGSTVSRRRIQGRVPVYSPRDCREMRTLRAPCFSDISLESYRRNCSLYRVAACERTKRLTVRPMEAFEGDGARMFGRRPVTLALWLLGIIHRAWPPHRGSHDHPKRCRLVVRAEDDAE
jgi:hypothetical protein